MDNSFQIWVDRLKNGKTQTIGETSSAEFLDLKEDELTAGVPVLIHGKAYLTENELILNLNASTLVKMPCAICNEMTDLELEVENFYHAQPLNEIPSGIYDFRTPLREALLLELPNYVECNQGNCPKRTVITPFLKEINNKEDVHFPFSQLNDLGDSNGSTS